MQVGLGHAIARAGRPSAWLDHFLLLRDRLLISPRFQRWAAACPLTRPIAQRRTRALFDLCAGFVFSQVLLACVRLNLFDALAEGPQTMSALAHRLSLTTDATERLVSAAVSLRLLALRGKQRYGLGALGAALAGNPAVAAMIEHHTLLYADLQDPVELLRERRPTKLARYWPYAGSYRPAGLTATQVGPYTALMSVSQSLIAEDVLDAYPLHRHRCLLDVGGGDGTFLAAAGTRTRGLHLILFDLPAVADRAMRRFSADGLTDRATVVGGNFLSDSLPRGADIVSLVRVLHDHDDDSALAVLRAVRLVVPQHGVLLLAEPMSGTRGAEPITDAYFGFYLLAMGAGRLRTPREIAQLVTAAGFWRMQLLSTRRPLLTRAMLARPSKENV
jgi:demethylspheroidene O-methyltransferase